ncbi:MAG TPA: cytochrome P450, partial [Kofleriaceae bacterium]|nr:cytochrome P450 [Kofleriaceae bacterium]
MLGWFLRYWRDPYGVFEALVRRFDDPFFVELPETRGTVVTGHPDGARAIVSADHRTLVPWRLPSTAPVLTDDSIFLQAGERHHATRRMLAPLFHQRRHADHCAVMMRVVGATLDRLAPGPVNAHDLGHELSLRIILAVLFGDIDEARTARFRDATTRALDRQGPTLLYLPWLRRRSRRWARIAGGIAELRELVGHELDLRRRAGSSGGAEARDMLGELMTVRRPDGSSLPDREIRVHLADLVVAGHETTAVAFAWACYELCRHPDVLARVVAEVDAQARGNPAGFRYLQAVCDETLRLHPPLVFLTREVARPLRVRDRVVPPGRGVSIAVPLVHRNRDVYGDPARFRPERFLERSFGPHEYLPFGGGAKRCLGATFAQQELAILVAGLLARFTIRLRRDRPIAARPRVITVAPAGGVELVLARRAAAPRAAGAGDR